MDDAFWQWAKTPREQGGAGLQSGQRIKDDVLLALQREYVKQSQKWELVQSDGKWVRMNPQTGMGIAMTNAQGQPWAAPVKTSGGSNPYDDYMNVPAVAGATTVDPNSMAFQGVQPTVVPAAAPQGNAVAPVNVNPAVPAGQQGAGSMGQGVQTNAAPMFRSEDEVIAAARAGQLSKAQAQAILVNQFGLDP